jgi:hypothetical protein
MEVVARGCSFMLDGGRCAALKRRGGIGMANKKKKAVTKTSTGKKKAAPSLKKKVAKKTLKKRVTVKKSKPAAKKKPVKNAARKSTKKAIPRARRTSAPVKKVISQVEDIAPRKSVVAKPAVAAEPEDVHLDEDEMVSDEVEVEDEIDEDEVQEELDLDADDDRDELIGKSEDLLDDDYRNN